MDLKKLINMCKDIKEERTTSGVYLKLSEEVGELATELNIKYHGSYKKKGKDGIIGECVDAIICLADILNKEGVDVDKLEEMFDSKVKKWKSKLEKEV